jgi:hypothetical protein
MCDKRQQKKVSNNDPRKLTSVPKHLCSQDDRRELSPHQSRRAHQQRDWPRHHQEYRICSELAEKVGDLSLHKLTQVLSYMSGSNKTPSITLVLCYATRPKPGKNR